VVAYQRMKTMEYLKPLSKHLVAVFWWRKVVVYKRLQRKILVFWIGGRLSEREVVAHWGSTVFTYTFCVNPCLRYYKVIITTTRKRLNKPLIKKGKTFCENRLFVLAMFPRAGVLNFHDIISLPRNQSRKGKVSMYWRENVMAGENNRLVFIS